MNALRLLLCFVFALSISVKAQKTTQEIQEAKQDSIEKERPVNKGYVTLGVSGSIYSFFGDLNVTNNISTLNNFRINPGLHVEKRFTKNIAAGVDYIFGKISQNERTGARNLNFETSVHEMGGHVGFYFDTKAKHVFTPFINVGINYILFDVKADLKDKDGNTYYYWDDNFIRNQPQKDTNGVVISQSTDPGVEVIERDFVYESEVQQTFDPSKETGFKTSAISIPITLGAKFKLTEFFDLRLSGTYGILQSDYLDGFVNGKNDNYFNTKLSLHFTLGKKFVSEREKKYKGVDFGKMAKTDADRDGVSDIYDECPSTPTKVKVNAKGCPLDDDNDGVANYLDKEPNSKPGATVNRDGITLSAEELEKLYQIREQVYMEKVEKFYEAPSDSTLSELGLEAADVDPNMLKVQDASGANSLESIREEIQAQVDQGKVLILPIPENGRFADYNGDGKLQPKEVNQAIDDFLGGETDISVTDLMDLIQYFFEQ